jgi:hypothetical protein
MPGDPTPLIRQILGAAGVLYRRARNAPNVDEMADVLFKLDALEAFYTEGLRKYGLKPERITVLKGILGDAIYGAKEVTAEMFSVVVDDGLYLQQFIKGLDADGIILTSGYAFSMDDATMKAVFQNLSTGTARQTPRVFKQFAHNNHLTRQAIQNPNLFIGDALGSMSGTVPKITDLELWIEIPSFQLTTRDGSVLDVLRTGGISVPVTFDSKVFKEGIKGVQGAFEQQFELFFTDRVRNLVVPILDDLARQSSNVSAADKRRFLEAVLPGIFRHYVFVPKDFPKDVDGLTRYYAERMAARIPEFLPTQMGNEVSGDDYELVLEILLDHAEDHFGTGMFINRNSEMSYAWLTAP